ncbi:MAG: hypothetical protein LQ338_008316 [Usnochroma carphineum]|nr:MAG: hypothetical protein LQ338_008316 [Usnochroma carphineum]
MSYPYNRGRQPSPHRCSFRRSLSAAFQGFLNPDRSRRSEERALSAERDLGRAEMAYADERGRRQHAQRRSYEAEEDARDSHDAYTDERRRRQHVERRAGGMARQGYRVGYRDGAGDMRDRVRGQRRVAYGRGVRVGYDTRVMQEQEMLGSRKSILSEEVSLWCTDGTQQLMAVPMEVILEVLLHILVNGKLSRVTTVVLPEEPLDNLSKCLRACITGSGADGPIRFREARTDIAKRVWVAAMVDVVLAVLERLYLRQEEDPTEFRTENGYMIWDGSHVMQWELTERGKYKEQQLDRG